MLTPMLTDRSALLTICSSNAPALPTRVLALVENARPIADRSVTDLTVAGTNLLGNAAGTIAQPAQASGDRRIPGHAKYKKLNFSFFNFCVAWAKSNNKLQALKNVSSEIK